MGETKEDRISEQEAKINLEKQTGIEFNYTKASYNEDTKKYSFEVITPGNETVRQFRSLDSINSNFPVVCEPEDFEPYKTLADYLQIPFFGVFDHILPDYGIDWEPGVGQGENIYCWTDKKGWLEITEIESAFLAKFGNHRKNFSMKNEKWTVKIFGNCCHGTSYKKSLDAEWPTEYECELSFDDLKDKLIRPGDESRQKKHPVDNHDEADKDGKSVITEEEKAALEKAAAEARETTEKVIAEAVIFAEKTKALEQALVQEKARVQELTQENDNTKKLLEQERARTRGLTQEITGARGFEQDLAQERNKTTELESEIRKLRRRRKAGIIRNLVIIAIIIGLIIYAVSNGNSGSSAARTASSPPPQTTPEMFNDRYVHFDGLNVREGPSVDTRIITSLAQNSVIKVSDEDRSGVWVRINYGNLTGFVNETYLRDFNITEMLVGDKLSSGDWAVQPGTALTGRYIRYLGILVNVTTLNSYNAMTSFKIKIIDPNGNLRSNPDTSPPGYTRERSIMINKNGSYDLGGWGAATAGSYYSGLWRIEIWYEHPRNPDTNALIASGTFQFQ